ncbi:hypothetical protein LTR36_004557 [Oleoguttula mirabilis]|uniref:Mitochondrial fission process protein 1 n=1 Tax=Oleoguttula mirabilis TaxID=1507867 RepID=A0AAV9JGT4_9PEZI|nr:hypothetical protein LTR36_004557 [Oleoguttula mirabilis]
MARDPPKPDADQLSTIEHTRAEPRPDFSKPLPHKTLPQDLQDVMNSEEKWWALFSQGKVDDSTNSPVRYAAYASRFRTILVSAQRYVAYTSDIGESFRPVAHPYWVRTAYGVSWAYLVGDVGYEGYKAYVRNQATLHPAGKASQDLGPGAQQQLQQLQPQQHLEVTTNRVAPIDHWGTVMAQRALFQGLASMGLPAFTIHSIVRYSSKAMKQVKNQRIRTWGPIGLGLAAVPALPFIFDKPVEVATEWVFHKAFETIGGPEAVGHRSVEGTIASGTGKRKEGVVKEGAEKEL